ncbi:uncharacterized protein LOC125500248 [Athalia rosae]|uniref:uncharacterized protein LOC125500248 n=1 Tax=Athalia rosae TaxID=37344 RepID=UPI00203356E7|nr:uncharacterized protein LOC125500248 [Athalia rosae]
MFAGYLHLEGLRTALFSYSFAWSKPRKFDSTHRRHRSNRTRTRCYRWTPRESILGWNPPGQRPDKLRLSFIIFSHLSLIFIFQESIGQSLKQRWHRTRIGNTRLSSMHLHHWTVQYPVLW